MNKALEELVHLGFIEKEFTLFGKNWKLRTLEVGELIDADNAISGKDILSYSNQIRVEHLARAIISVDGMPLEALFEGTDALTRTPTEKRREILFKCTDVMITPLYKFFTSLLDEQRKMLIDPNLEEKVKNLQGTPEGA